MVLQDLQTATNIASGMVTSFGMSDTLGQADLATNYETLSSETKQQIEGEIRRILDESRQRVTKLLNERRKELDTLAKGLVDYEVLTLDEVHKVLKGEKLQKLTSTPSMPLKLPEIVLPPGLGGIPSPGPGGVEGSAGGNDSSGPEGSGGARI